MGLQSKLERSLSVEVAIKPIVGVNKERHDCLVLRKSNSHFKFNKLVDLQFFIVGCVVQWFRIHFRS